MRNLVRCVSLHCPLFRKTIISLINSIISVLNARVRNTRLKILMIFLWMKTLQASYVEVIRSFALMSLEASMMDISQIMIV